MDRKLLAWGRAVKSRRRKAGLHGPVLWLFTDPVRLPDPRAAVRALPKGLCGVVLRHDADPQRRQLARDLATLCRARRLTLVIAGDWRLAHHCHAGLHLRNGKRCGFGKLKRRTSSAHDTASLCHAKRHDCDTVFLSPLFATESHPGAPSMGTLRWRQWARLFPARCVALGGIDGRTVRGVPDAARGIAGIGAFAPPS